MSRRRIVAVVSALSAAAALAASLAGPAGASRISVSVSRAQISTHLGDRFTFRSTVVNHGQTAARGLIAHLNIVGLESAVYVDPEDWSSHRTIYLDALPAGESTTITWRLQAVSAGDLDVCDRPPTDHGAGSSRRGGRQADAELGWNRAARARRPGTARAVGARGQVSAELAGALDALEPVVGERLPARHGAREDVLHRLAGKRVVDRAEANAGLVGVGPAAAEEVRSADRAEGLRGALLRLVGAQELLALEDPHLVADETPVRGADAAGELLAGRAVTEGARGKGVRDLEPDPAALAASA
jgi:hypothetical protein